MSLTTIGRFANRNELWTRKKLDAAATLIADKIFALLTERIGELIDKSTSKAVRRMLNAEQVLELIPISRTTLFRWERDDLFPEGCAVAPHRKLWFEDQVIGWQEELLDPDSPLRQQIGERVTNEMDRRATLKEQRDRSLPRTKK